MRYLSLVLVPFILLTGCTFKPGCIIQDKMVDIASNAIVDKLQCMNRNAVAADMKNLVSGIGLCKQVETGVIADTICPVLSAAVVLKITNAAIPAEWGCLATDARARAIEALTSACKQLPVSQPK